MTVVTTGTGGGGAVTVMAEVPLFPADVAVTLAEPADTPVATPLAFTVATPVLFEDHVIL